jgi:hypothetical protein
MSKVIYSRDEALLVVGGRRYVFVPAASAWCGKCAFRGGAVLDAYGGCWYVCRFPHCRSGCKCRKASRKDGRYGYWRRKNET